VAVSDIPRRAVTRSAKLAGLPLGVAGRATIGFGKRLGGRPAELVAAELQARTAEQLFQVLGQLKGGAMKLGQALSVFEAALPEDLAAPYRAALTRLQEAAPPLPATTPASEPPSAPAPPTPPAPPISTSISSVESCSTRLASPSSSMSARTSASTLELTFVGGPVTRARLHRSSPA